MREVLAFKFLRTEHIDFMVSEKTVILSRISKYRRLNDDPWIDDDGEAKLLLPADISISPGSANYHRHRLALGNYGMTVADGGTLILQNSPITLVGPNLFVFCASLPPFASARKAMCETAPLDHRYDACVFIKDFSELARRIMEEGRAKSHDNIPLSKVFTQAACGPVKYIERNFNLGSEPSPIQSFFLKPPFFRPQQEIRSVFLEGPGSPLVDAETITVQLSSPVEDLFKEVFRNA